VVGTLRDGEGVDVGGCTGSWCQVSFSGGSGYASRNYLAMGGAVGPGPAVAATPYVYDEPDYGYYDYGYAYGPSFGFYAGPRYRHGWHGQSGWHGRGHAGNWNGHGHAGNWNGRGHAGAAPGSVAPRSGFAGPPANWQRPGTGIGAGGRVSAPVAGTAGGAVRGTAGAAGGAAQAGSGFAGSMVRGGR
jgi:hypothetical protein